MSGGSKHELRSAIRARLRALSPDERAEKSRRICAAIATHPAFLAARRIMVFDAMPSEPDLTPLWHDPAGPRRFIFPRVRGQELELVEVAHPDELGHPIFIGGYREPLSTTGQLVTPAELDLVLVPGLAFTRDGHRLGRGGGYYDRLLALVPTGTARLGVCFALQLVEKIPLEPHDQLLDAVITEAI